MIVKENDLNRFLKRIIKYNNQIEQSKIADIIGDIGVDIARNEYLGTQDTNIRAEKTDEGVDICAYGKELAFAEFGTGVMGKGTYDGKLPTMTLRFESPKGIQQSTRGWEYNYRAEQAKQKGIIIKDFKGYPARAQMFKTGQKLRGSVGEKIVEYIRGK